MAHGVARELAKIPPHRWYNYQPSLQQVGLCHEPIKGAFTPAGPQVAKRERMAARAERRAAKGMKPKKGRKARAVSNA